MTTMTSNIVFRSRYQRLNRSFRRTLVYHLGIDAGFFAEYSYLVGAILWCLQHRVRLVLYSEDANFGHHLGWQDYFETFCDEVHDTFHSRYNRHRTPSWRRIFKLCLAQRTTRYLRWKLKSIYLNLRGDLTAWRVYGERTLLNHHIRFSPNQHFSIPELDIQGDYLAASTRVTDILWHLRPEIMEECQRLKRELALPTHYVGCQVRGGDKITEVNLLPPEAYIETLNRVTSPDTPIFVLTDDYRLFEQLQSAAPERSWYTLCQPSEAGYVNSSFSQQQGDGKAKQMTRFLCSMQLLLEADHFVGSITTGPSLFILKQLNPRITLMDCDAERFKQAICLPITERGNLAATYLKEQEEKRQRYTAEELEQLQQVLYEILGEVIRICKKHHIPYFVIGGTAIGTLYDGAILPWDDDIDIGMLRADYDRFLRIAPQELDSNYFLSWMGSDPHTPYYFAKVKKNHTCFTDPLFAQVPMHPGIFVDIFPFDRIPDHPLMRRLQHEAVKFVNCCLMGKEAWLWCHFGTCTISSPSQRGAAACLLNRIIDTLCSKRTIYRLMVSLQTAYNRRKTSYFNNVMTVTDRITEEQLSHLVEMPFGPLQVSAPEELEDFLRHNYPRLHRFTPEEVERLQAHYPACLSFDTRDHSTPSSTFKPTIPMTSTHLNPQPRTETPRSATVHQTAKERADYEQPGTLSEKIHEMTPTEDAEVNSRSKKPASVDVSVLILFFNRPDLLSRVFEQVRKARPSRLFLYQDGPRNERDLPGIMACREVVSQIDWECEVKQCYQERNYGCDPSEYMAQKWAFSLSDKCIVLEDDDVPSVSFFRFCKELLDRYEHDERVQMIAGLNHEEFTTDVEADYFFTTNCSIWGWASWRRVIDRWDEHYTFLDDAVTMQQLQELIRTRRYRNDFIQMFHNHRDSGKAYYESIFQAALLLESGLCIVPSCNMINNLGVTSDSTHFAGSIYTLPRGYRRIFTMQRHEMKFPLRHPSHVIEHTAYKERVYRIMGWGHPFIKISRSIEELFLNLRYGNFSLIIQALRKRIDKWTGRHVHK